MDIQDDDTEKSKPLMLFGRDIKKVPCFSQSMLYGIYGGIGFGLLTFLLTSRTKRSIDVAVGSYVCVSLVYWCVCRYDYMQQKNTVRKMQAMLARRSMNFQKLKGQDAEATEQTKNTDERKSV